MPRTLAGPVVSETYLTAPHCSTAYLRRLHHSNNRGDSLTPAATQHGDRMNERQAFLRGRSASVPAGPVTAHNKDRDITNAQRLDRLSRFGTPHKRNE